MQCPCKVLDTCHESVSDSIFGWFNDKDKCIRLSLSAINHININCLLHNRTFTKLFSCYGNGISNFTIFFSSIIFCRIVETNFLLLLAKFIMRITFVLKFGNSMQFFLYLFIINVYCCWFYFKGALMQIWKPVNILSFTCDKGFTLYQLSVFEMCVLLIIEMSVNKRTETTEYVQKANNGLISSKFCEVGVRN